MPSRFDLYCLDDGDVYLGDMVAEYTVCLAGVATATESVVSPPTLTMLQRQVDALGAKAPHNSPKLANVNAFMNMVAPRLVAAAAGGEGTSHAKSSPVGKLGLLRGRLRLAAKALYFDPDDTEAPVLSFKFGSPSAFQLLRQDPPGERTILCFRVPTIKLQRAGGRHHAHLQDTTVGAVCDHVFVLTSSSGSRNFLGRLNTMIGVALAAVEARDAAVAAIHEAAEKATPFSYSYLHSPLEEVIGQFEGERIAPLRRQRGRLVVSSRCVYFQPTFAVENSAVEVYPSSFIQLAACRRVDFEDRAFEIAVQLPRHEAHKRAAASAANTSAVAGDRRSSDPPYLFLMFAFHNTTTRDRAAAALRQSVRDANAAGPTSNGADPSAAFLFTDEAATQEHVARMCSKWCDGRISTLDYLMYLNWAAGRTFTDIAQYPVLPWVLADYTSPRLDLNDASVYRDLSKPIGALNEARLKSFVSRSTELAAIGQEAYLYGSHYSNPAYVTFWLLRERPEFMLALHTGKYDHASRLFDSMPAAWHSALNGPTDLKELIPQFYVGTGGFLVAESSSIDFRDVGLKSDGTSARADVALPQWATSAADFVKTNRDALEGEHVSRSIHLWIDLIFGSKQRGREAWAAHNVFHPHCYESAAGVAPSDPADRAAMLSHAREFGQIPAQLFTAPHPPRRVTRTPPDAITADSFLTATALDLSATLRIESQPAKSAAGVSTTETPHSLDDDARTPTRAAAVLEQAPEVVSPSTPWFSFTAIRPAWAPCKACSSAVKSITVLASVISGDPSIAVAADATGTVIWPVTGLHLRSTPLAIARDGVTQLVGSGTAGPKDLALATIVSRNGVVGALPVAAPGHSSSSRPPVSLLNPIEVTKSVLLSCCFAADVKPNGQRAGAAVFVGARDGTLQLVLLDPTSGTPVAAAKKPAASNACLRWDLESAVKHVAVSSNGAYVAAVNEDAALFHISAGQTSAAGNVAWQAHSPALPTVKLPPVCFSPSVECVALPSEAAGDSDDVVGIVALDDGDVVVVERAGHLTVLHMTDDERGSPGDVVRTCELLPVLGSSTRVTAVAALPDSEKHVVVGTDQGHVAVIDIHTGRAKYAWFAQPSAMAISAIAFHDQGALILVGDAAGNIHALQCS